jgi:hypothetical protein
MPNISGDDEQLPICVEVEISRADYAHLNQAMLTLTTRRQWARYSVFLLLLAALVIWVVAAISGDPWWQVALTVGIASLLVCALLFRFAGRINALFFYNSFRVDKAPTAYEIRPDSLAVRSSKFTGNVKWSAFHAFMRTQTHFLFWLNPIQAYLIPFDRLRSGDDARIWALVKDLAAACQVKVKA